MARVSDSDLVLRGGIRLRWRQSEQLREEGIAVARQTAAHFAHLAAELARRRVLIGKGPGPHPHRTDHKFFWEDTGLLEHAIHVEENPRVPSGVAEAQVVVDPVQTPEGEVNYGAYLEFGWTPILPSGATGHFTRYPFMGPAIADATNMIRDEAPIIFRDLYHAEGKKKVLREEFIDPSVAGPDEVRNKFKKL